MSLEAFEEAPNSLTLTGDEALILFDFVARFNKSENESFFKDQAEQRVLWNLECDLERQLVAPLREDYLSILSRAWERVRDKTN